MGHRIFQTEFATREEAERFVGDRGTPGYSERYHSPIGETEKEDGTIRFRVVTEEYYG